MMSTRLFLAAVVAAAIAPVAQAATITIDADQDTYIRGSSGGTPPWRDRNFNTEKLIAGSGYYPLVQFDLGIVAGQTITSAYIRGFLYEDPDGDYAGTGSYAHRMYLVQTDPNNSVFDFGMDEATMTYNIYLGPWNDDELLMEDLGRYSELGVGIPNSYKNFQPASVADLAALNTRASLSNLDQRYALFFVESTDPWRWWDNHEGDNPMQLVLEVEDAVVPEPSSVMLATLGGVVGLSVCLRRRKHVSR